MCSKVGFLSCDKNPLFSYLDLSLHWAHGLGARGTDSNMKLMLAAVL